MKKQIKYVDGVAEQIAIGLTPAVRIAASRYAFREFRQGIDRVAPGLGRQNAVKLHGEEASDAVRECIGAVTSTLEQWANGYTPMRWLWMLRRLPEDVFRGNLASTAGYDATLADVLSGRSGCQRCETRVSSEGILHYQLDASVIRRLARFCEGVRALSDLHRCYRWAGKGAAVLFKRGNWPEIQVSDDVRSAVDTYDQRVENATRPLSRMGSVLTSGDLSESRHSILWVQQISTVDIPIVRPGASIQHATPDDYILAACRYMPEPLPLGGFSRLLDDHGAIAQQVVRTDAAVLLFLLAALYVLVAHHSAGYLTLMTHGYLLWSDKTLAFQAIEGMLDQVEGPLALMLSRAKIHSTKELLDAISSVSGSSWPLAAGPICRQCNGGICIDFAAATARLEAALEYPHEQGTLANVRSQHFEQEVQAIIDRSPWRPRSAIRALRGRQLSLNGQIITDIDAIGERGHTLLAVDCKSFVYSDKYDIGDYNTVRNVSTRARDSMRHWSQVCAHFTANSKGDNYDFSEYDDICGVVCTPHVAYAEKEVVLAEVAEGLPSVASVVELGKWLGVPTGLQDRLRAK